MRELLFWSSLPFVLPQALVVRRRAPRFAGPSCATSGVVAGDRPVRLIGVGDSIIAGVGASTLERALVGQTAQALARALGVGVEWKCLGRIGATSTHVAGSLPQVLPSSPADFFVVSVGVNDITSLATLRRWRQSLAAIIDALSEHSPKAVIAVAGIPPLQHFPLLPQPLRSVMGERGKSFDRAASAVIARFPQALKVSVGLRPHRDAFAADGFHPSEASYAELAQPLATAMVAHAFREVVDV